MIRKPVVVALLSVALLGLSSTAVAGGDLVDPFARPRAKRPAPRAAPRSDVLDPWTSRPAPKPRSKTGKRAPSGDLIDPFHPRVAKPRSAPPPPRRPSAGELLDPWSHR